MMMGSDTDDDDDDEGLSSSLWVDSDLFESFLGDDDCLTEDLVNVILTSLSSGIVLVIWRTSGDAGLESSGSTVETFLSLTEE